MVSSFNRRRNEAFTFWAAIAQFIVAPAKSAGWQQLAEVFAFLASGCLVSGQTTVEVNLRVMKAFTFSVASGHFIFAPAKSAGWQQLAEVLVFLACALGCLGSGQTTIVGGSLIPGLAKTVIAEAPFKFAKFKGAALDVLYLALAGGLALVGGLALAVVLAVVSVLDSPDECIDDPVVSELGFFNEGLVDLVYWNDIIAVSNIPEVVSSVLFGEVFSVVDGKVDHVVPLFIVNHQVAVLVSMTHDLLNDAIVVPILKFTDAG